jgi:type VI secretion system protein ImpH
MASENRRPVLDLKDELLRDGHRFSFFQAVRLLRRLDGGKIRIRPELSLGFPAADVSRVEELRQGGGFRLGVNFLGLYGSSSPLPSFYTEDLLKDAREDSFVTREFLDIFHQRFFTLFYEAWKKSHLFTQIAEDKNENRLALLSAVSGTQEIFIRYTGLFGRHPRSALGLKTLLADFLGEGRVEIISFLPRRVQISSEQKLRLGSTGSSVGENSFLGGEIVDFQGKFRVRIGPLRQERFRSVVCGGDEQKNLTKLIRQYLTDPFEFDFEILLAPEELEPARLGERNWSGLGLDTVLFSGESRQPFSVVFGPPL